MEMTNPARRVAAIHDLSGLGKCALTIALPVLSALGCETAVLPTAFLSTHTGGFQNPVVHDLTAQMLPTAQHWLREGARFDALYSGFLASAAQIAVVEEIFERFRAVNPAAKILVDPVMGDDGKLYKTYTAALADGMKRLAEKADILVPNRTEACHLLGKPYRDGAFDRAEVESDLRALSAMGPETVVLTGVSFSDDTIGAACYSRTADAVRFFETTRAPGAYYGTGDLFASTLLGAHLNGFDVFEACGLAVRFTALCAAETARIGEDKRWGVKFERCLPALLREVFLENAGKKSCNTAPFPVLL